MSAAVWVIGVFSAFVIVGLVVDKVIGRYLKWRERRDLTIRADQLRKWNITAFSGTRKLDP
jgi:hypothetical protein